MLLVLVWLLEPKAEKKAPPPSGADIVYIAPLPPGKPKPKQQQQAPRPVKPTKPVKPQILAADLESGGLVANLRKPPKLEADRRSPKLKIDADRPQLH